jgi:hypothetical protein
MADIKQKYTASAAYTITLAALATSTTLIAGQESTAIDNTTNLYLDYLIGGQVTTGTSPVAGTIEVWAYGAIDDIPTYPDVLDGTNSAETFTSANIKRSSLRLIAAMATDTTSDRAYTFAPVSLKVLFGEVPTHHGIFITHDTTVNLNSTGGNHFIKYTPITKTVA